MKKWKAIRKVYVRAPNWLGDVIMATPAFARIRAHWIDAEIVCGIKKGHLGIMSGSKSFDSYLELPSARGWKGLWAEAKLLRQGGFDLAFLFPNSPRTALAALLGGVPHRVGYMQGRRLLMTNGLVARPPKRKDKKRWGPRREPHPMIDYWFGLCDLFEMPRVGPKPILRLSGEEEERGAARLWEAGLDPTRPFAALNPGAAFGPTKLWPNSHWARLAELLSERFPRMQLLLTPGPGEEEMSEHIRRASGTAIHVIRDPVLSLPELKAVLARAALMVTTDSGPRHIAVAFDTPHLVLMGPTHPGYTNRNLDKAYILRHDLPCGPCHLKTCPLGHECMTELLPEEAAAAAKRLLGGMIPDLPRS